jgi:ribosomal protein S13
VARLQARGDSRSPTALLDQRAIAGIGNVFKSEILFAAAVSPFTRVQALDAAALARIVAIAERQMRANVSDVGRRRDGRPDHDQPARSVGAPLGLLAARAAVPALRHADSASHAGAGHALDLLVRTLSALGRGA